MLEEQEEPFYCFIGKNKAEAKKTFAEVLCQDIEVSSLNYFDSDIDQDIVLHTVPVITALISEITYKAQEYVKNKHCTYLTNKHLSALMTKLNTKDKSIEMASILNNGAKPADNEALGSYIQHEVRKQLKKLNGKPTKKQKKLRKNSSALEKTTSGKPKKSGKNGKTPEEKPAQPAKKRTPKKVSFAKKTASKPSTKKRKGKEKPRADKPKDTRKNSARS